MAKPAKKSKPERKPPEPNPIALETMRRARAAREDMPTRFTGVSKRTPALEAAFLEGLATGYSVRNAATAAGISTVSVQKWHNASKASIQPDGTYKDDFCVRWAQAYEDGVDLLEDEAVRRAARGVERPVYQGGVLVGTTTEYSDSLMNLILKGKRGARYNVDRVEHTGKDGGKIAMGMEIEFIESKSEK